MLDFNLHNDNEITLLFTDFTNLLYILTPYLIYCMLFRHVINDLLICLCIVMVTVTQ